MKEKIKELKDKLPKFEKVESEVEEKEETEMGFFKKHWKKFAIGAGALAAGGLGYILLKGRDEDDMDESYDDEIEDTDEAED